MTGADAIPASARRETLGALLETFRDPDSAPRRRLARELPAATGFTRPVVEEGLARALTRWTARALAALLDRELGGRRDVEGFGTTAVLLAGAIPMPTLRAVLAPLVLGSRVVARPASRDPLTLEVVVEALGELDPELAARVTIARFGHDDDAALRAFLSADCVVLSGSDETIASLVARGRPAGRVVRHGHRVSVAALGPGAAKGARLEEAARALALDVALWDQLGCLSPAAAFVVGDAAAAERAAEAVAGALAEAAAELPRGEVPGEAAAAIAHERAGAELRGVPLHVGSAFTVVAERDARLRPAPLHRFLRLHPVEDTGALARALAPLRAHLAAVGTAGFADEEPGLAGLAPRVCTLGTLQAPPLSWSHDGEGVLLPLIP